MPSDERRSNEYFSAEQVEAAVVGLPDGLGEQVMADLVTGAAEAKKLESLQSAQARAADFAAAIYIDVGDENLPDGFDTTSWYFFTADMAGDFLDSLGMVPEELKSQIPDSAKTLAACFYSMHQLDFTLRSDEARQLLEPAGMSLDSVYETVIDLLYDAEVYDVASVDELKTSFPTIESFAHQLEFEIFKPLAEQMRRDMLAAGFVLPETGEDGTYGCDEEMEMYIPPEIGVENLPPVR